LSDGEEGVNTSSTLAQGSEARLTRFFG
jgi:hypothetical protein